MTRIDFHLVDADPIGYGCRLVRKIYKARQHVVVCCDDPVRLKAFDEALWTFSPQEFVPHVMASDALASETPVLLTASAEALPWHQVLVNLGDGLPEGFARFDRLIAVGGAAATARARGRERWRFYRDRGYPLEKHEVGAAERR
jgi:DNA polymerase-3 subunit chi